MKKTIVTLLILISCSGSFAQNIKQTVKITGYADFLKNGDTVKLMVYKYGLINQESSFHTITLSTVINGSFNFVLKGISFPKYITLQFSDQHNTDFHDYVIEPGDQINLNFLKNQLVISGKQCSAFKIQKLIRDVETNFHHKQRFPQFNAGNMAKIFSIWDSIASEQTDILIKHKREVSEKTFNFLANEINATFNWTKYYDLNYYGVQFQDSLNNPIVDSFADYSRNHQDRNIKADGLVSLCNNYVQYIIEKYKVDSCLLSGRKYDVSEAVQYFAKAFSGNIRQQLITATISDAKNYSESLGKQMTASLKYIYNPDYRELIYSILNERIDGATAFDFKFTDTNGKTVYLSNYKNKVVLLDFWYTGCGNCRELAPIMMKIENEFKNKQVQFIGVSIDKNKVQFKKSVQEGLYVSPEILNVYSNGYGVLDKSIQYLQVKDYPTLIIINRDGKIVSVPIDPRNDDGNNLSKLISEALPD
jgi:thiol-disulfide isomerase/thioredoxin